MLSLAGLVARHRSSSVAVIDADHDEATTYGELGDGVRRIAEALRRELDRGLVFLAATSTVESITLYLACLDAGCPVALLDPDMPERWVQLLEAYAPQGLLLPPTVEPPAGWTLGAPLPNSAYRIAGNRAAQHVRKPHPDLALLLTTSGSTGSPKVVRLTGRSITANAQSIVSYLGIEPGHRSIQSLPMHYSYGLSLVNTHLAAGATVVLTRHSFWHGEFWRAFDRAQCTSMAGVPHVYESLHRLRFDPGRHPSLRILTQAGGALPRNLIASICDSAKAAGCRFFVMYGQTEACARMSYVPWERLSEKVGSIGVPIPGGHLSLAPLEGTDQRELVYAGPNVMMGYAESAADLAAGDERQGVLRTGDLATVDADGFFYLTGRLNRFAKLFGRRISLEDVERDLEARYALQIAATDRDGQLWIYAAPRSQVDVARIVLHLAVLLKVPPKTVRVHAVDSIPLTSSGKKNYAALDG